MNTCPCCSNSMIRQFRDRQASWFCRKCWQEMPLIQPTHLDLVSRALEFQFASCPLVRSMVAA